jgi:hypothetical protein
MGYDKCMEYELRLNPFVKKPGWKYKTIQITDIAVHTNPKNPTLSIGKKIRQAFRRHKPGRIYQPIENSTPPLDRRTLVIEMIKKDPEFLKMVQDEEKNGCKVLLALPENIPLILGNDTIEFMTSIQGKRILRRLAKNNTIN